MKTLLQIGLLVLLCAGCASQGDYRHESATAVNLTQKNYKILHAGVVGKSYGFRLLGFIPIVSPSYGEAKSDIYKSTNETLEGRPIALANQTEDRSSLYLILFSVPCVTITADIIEFTDAKSQ